MDKKTLPVSISDFKDVIEKNYYYIDKTLFIEELLSKKAGVLLITRPRRFGKTLNMSTLKYFFDMKNGESNSELFRGLNISKTKYMSEQGKYPVISLTMKDLEGDNFENFSTNFKSLISGVYAQHEEIREKLNEREFIKFNKIWLEHEDGAYGTSLKFLSELLFKYHGIKPVLLIDEYDSPMIRATEHGYYEEVKNLMGTFYGSALKDGTCSFAVVTGILKVAKESIFSSLNNLDVSTILTQGYEWFGMSESEVEEILKYYGWETTLENTKNWYNGYLFGKNRVYNPWSILKHCQYGELDAFWINTSTNLLIKEILRNSDKRIFSVFHDLVKDGTVKTTLQDSMIFEDIYTEDTLLYLMFSAGYLTIDRDLEYEPGINEREYLLKIPNLEIKKYFLKTFSEINSPKSFGTFDKLRNALLKENISGDENSVEDLIQYMFTTFMSFRDGSTEEKFYHNLILGMMMLMDRDYHVFSNRESGYGIYDLALEPRDSKKIGYIFEFKVSKSIKGMNKLGEEALEQIENKLYETEFKMRGIERVQKIGMVFHKKHVKIYSR